MRAVMYQQNVGLPPNCPVLELRKELSSVSVLVRRLAQQSNSERRWQFVTILKVILNVVQNNRSQLVDSSKPMTCLYSAPAYSCRPAYSIPLNLVLYATNIFDCLKSQ
jgi:hypothetical protein